MPKYRVNWQHIVAQGWTALVEADSEEDAMEKLKVGEYENEELMDETGLRIENEEVEGEE